MRRKLKVVPLWLALTGWRIRIPAHIEGGILITFEIVRILVIVLVTSLWLALACSEY